MENGASAYFYATRNRVKKHRQKAVFFYAIANLHLLFMPYKCTSIGDKKSMIDH